MLEESNTFYGVTIEGSLSESYIENEVAEEDIAGLVEVNEKLEQLQKDMGRLEDKFEDRLDRLETLLGKLVEQQLVA